MVAIFLNFRILTQTWDRTLGLTHYRCATVAEFHHIHHAGAGHYVSGEQSFDKSYIGGITLLLGIAPEKTSKDLK